MHLLTGFNITSSDIANVLKKYDRQRNGVRTWRQLLGNANIGAQSQKTSATSSLSDTIAKAYESNLAQENAIMGAGLNVGATKDLLSANRRNLSAAYDTYIRNYGESVDKIATSYNQEVSAINTALQERAQNYADVYNSVYDYLNEELYGATFKRDDATLNYFTENDLDYLLNTVDKQTTLRAWDDIKGDLFDDEGVLTDKGIQFFDQVMNAHPEGYTKTDDEGNVTSVRGFDEWLSSKNPELREWWATTDAFNYTRAGTNKGTGNVMLGRESTDDIYHKYEYLDGTEIQKYTGTDFAAIGSSLEEAKADYMSYKFDADNADNPAFSSWLDPLFGTDSASLEKKAKKSWTAYQSNVDKFSVDFTTYLQTNLGAELYSDFYDEYSNLYTEYSNLVKEMAKSSMYDESLVKRLNKWKEDWFAAANQFVGKHKGVKKASGF